jgi:hypothetical protein
LHKQYGIYILFIILISFILLQDPSQATDG